MLDELFIIKHKKTKEVFCGVGHKKKGLTLWDGKPPKPQYAENPVFYRTEKDANLAINAWTKGQARIQYSSSSFVGPELVYDPVEGRSKDDLEVIPVKLTYGTSHD